MSTRKVILVSFDHDAFELEEAITLESEMIKEMIELDCANELIPLVNVTGKTLAKLIEFMKKHVEAANSRERTPDEDFWA